MINIAEHLISPQATIHDALVKINQLKGRMILFVVDHESHLIGTLTDGDIRRALVQDASLEQKVSDIMNRQYRFIFSGEDSLAVLSEIRLLGITLVPVLNQSKSILEVIDLVKTRSLLPVHAVLLAGGEGQRLRPLTEKTPKPLLEIGGKPIIQYNLELLARYGVKGVTLSVRYLGDQIKARFGDGGSFGMEVDYIEEEEPLGTMGSIRLAQNIPQDNLLVMNSDILTNLDLEDFYLDFKYHEAAMSVATVPHNVKIPYGVFETKENLIEGVQEKPTFTHYSNAGIYLIRKQLISSIPATGPFNATDMMGLLISQKKKLVSYPLRSYWLDIGRPEDFAKAEEDIRHIHF